MINLAFNIKDIGLLIYLMAKVLRHGEKITTQLYMRDILLMELSMESVNIQHLIIIMRVGSKITKSMERAE